MSFYGNLSRSCQQSRKALHVSKDYSQAFPETEICRRIFDLTNPWDFEEVYCSADLPLFAHGVPSYSGTPHPDRNYAKSERSGRSILHIDLNLSRYEKLAERFRCKTKSDMSFLKSGIETRNAAFNAMIAKMEQVGAESREPILLMGPTGSGKSRLAGLIYELRKQRHLVQDFNVELLYVQNQKKGENARIAQSYSKRQK